ncbi:MAG: four helix bundle protein [Acidobacteriota bacterium]
MAKIASFRDLNVWQKALTLADESYAIAKTFPRQEQHGLGFQIRRAASSIPANIAEGHSRHARQAYVNYVGIALGSLAELESHLELAVRTGLVPRPRAESALSLAGEVGRMLQGLARALRRPAATT